MLVGVEFGLFPAITLGNDPVGEFSLQLCFDCGIVRGGGEIVPFVRVLLHVEQFLSRSVLVAADFVRGGGAGQGSPAVLKLVSQRLGDMNLVNLATALHRTVPLRSIRNNPMNVFKKETRKQK